MRIVCRATEVSRSPTRPEQPNEVAPSLLFLACEDSSYMIGRLLHPDGGDFTSS